MYTCNTGHSHHSYCLGLMTLEMSYMYKLLLILAPKVPKSLYPECIANLKRPIDAFYRESRPGVNAATSNITTGLFGLHSYL